ncbi:MAG: Asp-tRNA(Asn)/Glu-tRNA(Gln) amidotransferase subunit GatB [Acidobacteriota bacterium]|nr:Asp-tRNA(Asn)/Glu-tRNA(Gln) amidotransferase subunit GatB [Acidobacteriota bacterium]MDE3030929.1 Asp-tRNA(Asn)/Glu-tRNA(Gln) amidotransferase subunit GatB [Acidobacteriota bacterium]MDE3093261.1 Asp-tRNA(Asn)/Glu-tRNA(Gln) amidotransferase subunit GatB [Acidobacteriota bacterium]MDE3138238.1 Asp-tRNA(Asn)/Glu-tRNA(Gln) amidotransferase subunit GatB [Acidobacteriota bacterium]MDE3147199.1 Asp-tRNA(Asn)/Glu-tRNA(Gln) amidotransferase subunit GatB [Acidobacteriota bacterium]
MTLPANWEMVVGLEVHTELLTKSKLFCGCANNFGAPPNTNICPVCLGLPGSLPVLNREAVDFAMRIGMALHCTIAPSTFHRKNYFYPDQSKDYQISQYDLPINSGGYLDLPDGSRVSIERAHMEEDTGKSTHLGGSGRLAGADSSLVDYNRCGVPLVEIVSGPDIRSAAQARAYAQELRGILIATGASDGRLEEGSMRFDANVSVRRSGEPFGTRCEIKNLNSLRSLQRAIDYEALRQVELLEDGGVVRQETRHWDENIGETSTLRVKEDADDYRYFRDPDLVELAPDQEWQDSVRAALAPMPAERRQAVVALLASPTEAQLGAVEVVIDLGLERYVHAVAKDAGDVGLALARAANEIAADIENAERLTTEAFVTTILMEHRGELSATQAKTVLATLLRDGGEPRSVAADLGFEQLSADSLGETVAELIEAHPEEWQRYREGDERLAQFFIGQVMKLTRGQANGKAVIGELQARR